MICAILGESISKGDLDKFEKIDNTPEVENILLGSVNYNRNLLIVTLLMVTLLLLAIFSFIYFNDVLSLTFIMVCFAVLMVIMKNNRKYKKVEGSEDTVLQTMKHLTSYTIDVTIGNKEYEESKKGRRYFCDINSNNGVIKLKSVEINEMFYEKVDECKLYLMITEEGKQYIYLRENI